MKIKSICFFASWYEGNKLPYYVVVYLKELRKHFSDVVLLTSTPLLANEDQAFLQLEGIKVEMESNEGFDFGLWYKAFQKHDLSHYDRVALVNDSCILFKPLDAFIEWCNTDNADLKGMTFSTAISPHVQSYFMVLNKKAIALATDYFKKHGILKNLSDVIATYEVGFSKQVISNGLTISSFVDNNGYTGEFSPYYHCVDYHLRKGIPLIKKKIIFASYRNDELFTLARMNFNISSTYYIDLISKLPGNLILDFSKLERKNNQSIGWFHKIKYMLMRRFILIVNSLRKKIG